MLEWLQELSASPWYLLILLGFCLADAVFPVIPSEVALILGGVAAGVGSQNIVFVIVAAATGAIVGDNITYAIGRESGSWVERRFLSGRKGARRRRRLDWATDRIDEQGILLLVTARFLPGGRTATTLAWGITGQRWPRFVLGSTIAGLVWATYGALLGLIGGRRFADHEGVAFLAAFGASLLVTLVIFLVRKLRKRGQEGDGQASPESTARTSSSVTSENDE